MNEFEQKLTQLQNDLKTYSEKAAEDRKSHGDVLGETKTALDAIRAEMKQQQTQLDAIDKRTTGKDHIAAGPETLGELFTKSEKFQAAAQTNFSENFRVGLKDVVIPKANVKATIMVGSGLTNSTPGVINAQRIPGIVGLAQQELRIRDVMPVRTQSTGNTFDWVSQNTRTNAASPQVEGSAKAESTYGWTVDSGTIRTIAHFVNVSRQALDDVPWLKTQIDTELVYGLKLKEEAEILSGDGTGVHLSGILTEATAFDTTYLVAAAGWTRLDALRYAKLQARLAGLATYAPSAYVLNPTDMAQIELTKDANGLYIVGDPRTGMEVKFVWGLPVVESDSITAGTFLVGAFATGVELIDRMAPTVGISFEHSSNFTSNLATILCEERIGIAIKKANAFITGTFTTSP